MYSDLYILTRSLLYQMIIRTLFSIGWQGSFFCAKNMALHNILLWTVFDRLFPATVI